MRKKILIALFVLLATEISVFAQLGIGNSNPITPLDIKGTLAAPATSGSSANGIFRLRRTSDNIVLDMGINDVNPIGWMQVRSSATYAARATLLLQPVGGKVAIGPAALSETLNVSGDVVASGVIRGAAAGSVLNMVSVDETDLNLTSSVQSTSTSRTALFSYSYTPVSSQSDILIEVIGNATISGGGGDEWKTYLVVGSSDLQVRFLDCDNSSGGGGRGNSLFPMSGLYQNSSSSTAITIKVDIENVSSDDTFTLVNDVTLVITEIAR